MSAQGDNNIKEIISKMDAHLNDSKIQHERIFRIETKVDKLADAVIAIARAEEKIAVLMEDTKEIKDAVIDSKHKIQELELKTESNTSDLKSMSKFFWIVISSVVAVIIGAIIMSLGIIN